MRVAPGTISVDRGWTKVARVERGKMMGAPRGLEWDSRGRARIVGDEGQSRKPRVTLERKITWSATTEGLYSWQSGEGRDNPRSGGTPRPD
jgi:hypothetical protein